MEENSSDEIRAPLIQAPPYNDGDDILPSSSSPSEALTVEKDEEEENSPIKQVALTVPTTDDASLPVLTFRMWVLGTLSCALLSFLNQFFWYRTEPLSITAISAQIAVVPLGQLMAARITDRVFFKGSRWEYAIHVVTDVKIFYKQQMTFIVSLIVVLTTQKQSIALTKQVEFYALVHEDLVQKMGSNGAQTHLSKSLFVIVIGSNDLFGYFNKDSKVSKQYTPQQYIDLMASTLKGLIKRMYGLGARKFVVSGVGVIGCCPAQRKQNSTGECKAEANYWAMQYNEELKALLRELKSESSDINYSYSNTYDVMNGLIQHPQTYGLTEIKAACCGLGNLKADIPCIPIATYCSNRKNHLFWDLYHPTETASGIFANTIYSGSQKFTTPMNVEQLINV